MITMPDDFDPQKALEAAVSRAMLVIEQTGTMSPMLLLFRVKDGEINRAALPMLSGGTFFEGLMGAGVVAQASEAFATLMVAPLHREKVGDLLRQDEYTIMACFLLGGVDGVFSRRFVQDKETLEVRSFGSRFTPTEKPPEMYLEAFLEGYHLGDPDFIAHIRSIYKNKEMPYADSP